MRLRHFMIMLAAVTAMALAACSPESETAPPSAPEAAAEPASGSVPPPAPDYADAASWAALPQSEDYADYTPEGVTPAQATAAADVFFIHPTTYLSTSDANAAFDEPASAKGVDELVMKHQASVFNACCRIYAPRYRQAGLGAFGPDSPERNAALEFAYEDVKRAFRHYLETWNEGRPFLIASHSQGSRYALWLLQDVVEKDPALLKRFVSAYIVGYAIPLDVYDRTLSTIKPCLSVSDARCVLNWSSYLEGNEGGRARIEITQRYPGGVWERNEGKALQCTNPLVWTEGDSPDWAPASLNKGALIGNRGPGPLAAPETGTVGARCTNGILEVRVAPDSAHAGKHRDGDYHNLDYSLFYMNIRENAAARVEAFVRGAHLGQVIDEARIVPPAGFDEMPVPPAPDYATPLAWAALPSRPDFADFVVEGATDGQATSEVDVFFLYPTTFLFDEGWNSPIDHPIATARVDYGVLKNQASVFNGCCRVFAPRYRQATLYSFYPPSGADGQKALELAYEDVKAAFDYYIENLNEGRPFILGSHSQGTRHLIFLLRDVIANHPARERFIAAYAIGYPLPMRLYGSDYGEIRPCASATDSGCVINYGTWGEGGPEPEGRTNGPFQCSNPLSWDDPEADMPRSASLGALRSAPIQEPLPRPVAGQIGAQCRNGVLWADVPEDSPWYGARRPPNNYHNLDYSLFYMDLRANLEERVEAFLAARGTEE